MLKRVLCLLLTGVNCLDNQASELETELLPLPELRDFSLEELMQIDVVVTSAAKKAQTLFNTAAAVFVITQEDIRRSGVTNIPEALRMAPGVQVAHIDANKWAISIRGFNGRFANKLLVLIDGRSVYTPLFSGVFWNEQDLPLEDLERIEVIRGPGATLWGVNAVNGIINIITKSAKDTQGKLITAGAGTEERGFVTARYGGMLSDAYYRIYAKYFKRDNAVDLEGASGNDEWDIGRGGFRLDWEFSTADAVTFQGDIYDGNAGQTLTQASLAPPFFQINDSDIVLSGGNLLGRWQHILSPSSQLGLQLYFSREKRATSDFFEQRLDTVDIDFQHEFQLGEKQEIIWGLNYQYNHIASEGSFAVSLEPNDSDLNRFSAFLQNEIALLPEQLRLTLGSKLEHNEFTGFEVQPNARLLWTPHPRHALWAAASRAVRTPSIAERNARSNQQVFFGPSSLPNTSPLVGSLIGNRDFDSESVVAFELGYRSQPKDRLFADIALFYNLWNDLRTTEPIAVFPEISPLPPHVVIPFSVSNKMAGESYGAELVVDWQLTDRWELSAAYSYLDIQLHPDDDSRDITAEAAEGQNPHHQFSLRSSFALPKGLELDLWLRYVDNLPALNIDSYTTLDARLGWKLRSNLEFSVVGQNLLNKQHPEFIPEFRAVQPTQVERGIYGKITWHF